MPPAGAVVGRHSATRCHPPRVKMANSGGDGKQTSTAHLMSPLPVYSGGVLSEMRRVTIVRC